MLRWRLLGALTILIPLLVVLWLDDQHNAGRPGIWTGPLALGIALLATGEVNQLIRKAGLATSATANLWGVFCVVAFSLGPIALVDNSLQDSLGKPAWTLVGLAVAVASLFACELYRYRVPGESIARLAGGLFVTVYIGVMLGFLVQLRLLLPGRAGLIALVATILVVKFSDTGAFFVGKAFGKTHFTLISPKKTIEGVGGGVVAAMLAALAVRQLLIPYFAPQMSRGSLAAYLAFGASLAVAGLLGDLSESLLKRDVEQKDSSQWMRGLGGVLDVIDSMLSTAPVSFLWWATGWL